MATNTTNTTNTTNNTSARPFAAKFSAGRCEFCRKPIIKGQFIYYVKGEGSTHKVCVDEYRAQVEEDAASHDAWERELMANDAAIAAAQAEQRRIERESPVVDFGHGFTSHNSDRCDRCGGTGSMPYKVADGICFKCEGAGRILRAR